MDFSNDVFRTPRAICNYSDDAMSHANMVMACRFGWGEPQNGSTPTQDAPHPHPPSFNPLNSTSRFKSTRFTPCSGRLYHQLLCSHRIRTDIVEDCGPNCLDPAPNAMEPAVSLLQPFFCQECLDKEAASIWSLRETQHNATYPPLADMTKEQYEVWYTEHRELEAQYHAEFGAYKANLLSTTRPSHTCAAVRAAKEDVDFATELDALALSMVSSNDSRGSPTSLNTRTSRISLPTDASEQLHWNLNSLALHPGACGIEYSASQATTPNVIQTINDEDLWRKPRGG